MQPPNTGSGTFLGTAGTVLSPHPLQRLSRPQEPELLPDGGPLGDAVSGPALNNSGSPRSIPGAVWAGMSQRGHRRGTGRDTRNGILCSNEPGVVPCVCCTLQHRYTKCPKPAETPSCNPFTGKAQTSARVYTLPPNGKLLVSD